MRKYTILIVISLSFIAARSWSQGKVRGSVKGAVVDSAGKQNLADATVSLTPESDTTESAYAI